MPNIEDTIRNEIRLLTDGKGNTNYCIKAGAGAGKTTLLSQRISRQLVKDPAVPINEFVVITYTNTAASELHSKISEELNKVISSGTDSEKNNAVKALSQLDLMQISTIHSFLFDILREHSFDSGVAMDVQMLDNSEEENRRFNFFNAWYMAHRKEIAANRMCDGDWIILDSKLEERDKERDVFFDTFNTLANIRDDIVCGDPMPADEVVKLLEDTARSFLSDLLALKECDEIKRPYKYPRLTKASGGYMTSIEIIKSLKEKHPLCYEDIELIRDTYQIIKKGNKIFEEFKDNNDIGTFKVPDPQLQKFDAVDKAEKKCKALKKNNKGPDPELLAGVEQDAKDLLDDLIRLKDYVDRKKPVIGKYKPSDKASLLLKKTEEYSALKDKAPLTVSDISIILDLYDWFLGFAETNFYSYLNNADIGTFVLPPFRTEEYEKLKNILGCQRGLRVVRLALEMQKEYQEEIDSESLRISNDDILYRSKVLLENHPEILEKLRKRYSKIYIDEFQDTTPVQTEIMKMLSSKPGTPAGVFNPDDDKLFVVGDPKQSIYRFTGADKSLFESLYGDFENDPDLKANGQPVVLNINYRSNSDIVSWVNETFDSPEFPSCMKDNDWTVTDPNALHGVYRYPAKSKYTKDADVEAVVNLVDSLVGKPYCLLMEGKNKPVRMIRYSDITVVFRDNSNINHYLEKFTQRDNPIPVSMQGKYRLDNDEIIRNFVILLDFFANSKNKTKITAAAQVLAGVDSVKYDIGSARKELFEIRDNVIRKNRMDAASTVQYFLSREDLFLPKKDMLKTWEISQYRIRLHQMTEACLENNDGDLRTLVDSMYEYLSSQVEHEIELEKGIDAVKFINVHKVKGMSEQIVIIADRSKNEKEEFFAGFRSSDGNYYPSASYRVSFYNNKREYFPTFIFNEKVAEEAVNKVKADLMCLQYVAATRARNALIIMPIVDAKPCWFRFPKEEEVIIPGENEELPEESKSPLRITDWLDKQKEAYEATEHASEPSGASTSVSKNKKTLADLGKLKEADLKLDDSQLISITPSSLEKDFQTGYTKKEKGFILEDDRPGNNIFGTVMHRTFELIVERRDDINPSNKAEQAKRAINQAILESSDDIADDAIRKLYYDYLTKVIIDKGYLDKVLSFVEGADEVYTEFDFSFFVPEGEHESFLGRFKAHLDKAKIVIPDEKTPIWVNGQADLVVRKGDQVTVYDYKSDKTNGKPIPDFEAALIKKYEGQLELYKYAIGKAFGLADVKADKGTLIHLYL